VQCTSCITTWHGPKNTAATHQPYIYLKDGRFKQSQVNICILIDEFFLIENQEEFQTNSSVHNINTRSKHDFHGPVANLSCFQKGTFYSGIKIFNSLPRSITSLKNEKTQFRIALKKFLYAHFFYSG
jgi:hypothetical protein